MDRNFLYRKMHALLKELNLLDSKTDLLFSYGVQHTTELSDPDLQHLIARLENIKKERNTAIEVDIRHWRSIILSILNKYGIYEDASDWTRVNGFLLHKRVCGKLLFELSVVEMQMLAIRLRAILKKKCEKTEKLERLTILN